MMPRRDAIRSDARPPRTVPTLAATLLRLGALMALTACGNLTAGGLDGEAVVTVSGEADAPEGAAAMVDDPGLLRSQQDDERPEGEVEVEFQILLVTEDGTPVELSDDEVRVRVDVRGRQEAEVVRRDVPAVRYRELRMVFTEIEVEIESGLIIDGVPLLGDLRVRLEDGTITVARPIDVVVLEEERVDLLVNLNADTWLRAADPVLREVAEQVFATAIEVVVR